jgi:hypothetical protein
MSDNIQFQEVERVFDRRVRCKYTPLEEHLMRLRKQNVLNELEILVLTGISIIHENQEIIALKVITAFRDSKIVNIMVVSKTQSGKTGSMCATIKQYLEDPTNLISIENFYIITGLSSCEWKDQTKERLPTSVQSRVFHRCDLPNTFVDEIRHKKNVLIIMDEIQVAAKKGQTIYKSFEAAGLLDKQRLYENDIKILEYTATPDGTIYDLMKWKDASAKILAKVGDGYVSSFELLQQGRVKQYKDICGYDKTSGNINEGVLDNIREIKGDIDGFAEPKYHIIRTKNGVYQDKTIANVEAIFGTVDYDYIKYDGGSDIEDINNTLRVSPNKHTIIFIKEMLRCAKTLTKRYLGVSYERYAVNPDDASIIQGLVGRNTGYDNNGVSICYTNIDSIRRYEKLWISDFEDTSVKWNSKTTKFVDGILRGQNTFLDTVDYDGLSVDSDESEESEDSRDVVIKKCKTQEEAKQYYITVLKPRLNGRGPNKVKPNADGFYETTINYNKRVYSCQEIETVKKRGLNNGNYRFYPCYKVTTDKTTLEWWLIHY